MAQTINSNADTQAEVSIISKASVGKTTQDGASETSKAKRAKAKLTYYNAVKFKITDLKLVNYLNYIHEIFLNAYELINQQNIQPYCFTKKELSHLFRGHFTQKLAELINKDYLSWDLNNKAKYFRMFSLHLRQDFKSLDYKQKITQVLENMILIFKMQRQRKKFKMN